MESEIKIFITGITGFLGRHLSAFYSNKNNVNLHGAGRRAVPEFPLPKSVTYHSMDITDEQAINQLLEKINPDVIIHTAAMSSPNVCEEQQDLTRKVNVDATRFLAGWSARQGRHLIHLSTDFVFGDHGPFCEEDEYGPVNFYGQSKREAEEAILDAGGDWAIVRPVLIYGPAYEGAHSSFPQWVKAQLESGKSPRIFTDQFRTATYVGDLVWGIDQLVQKRITGKWHLSGAEVVTPFSFAQEIARHLGLDETQIQPITSSEMAEPAKRPFRSTLDISKARAQFGFAPRGVKEGLKLTFSQVTSG